MIDAPIALAFTAGVQAQTIEKMKQFKVATTDLNLPVVPQEGRNAAAIRNTARTVGAFALAPGKASLALSPEFIYALGPGQMMPDPERFGIVWMPRVSLEAAYDLDGAFSNLVLKLAPGTNPDRVIETLDRLTAPYGGTGASPRKDQISHAFLDAELRQLSAMVKVLPPIFLLVSAFLVNMTLSRLIALEREQIGLLKAMGYSSLDVARHYVGFVTLIAILGISIGIALGTWLGMGMTRLYAQFFSFPFLVFSRNPAVWLNTFPASP